MLYALRKSPHGRQRGEFPLGQLRWQEGLIVEVRDRSLRDTLRTYFQQPVWVPLPLGNPATYLSNRWERLDPGDEEHFLEAARRLYHLDLYLDLASSS